MLERGVPEKHPVTTGDFPIQCTNKLFFWRILEHDHHDIFLMPPILQNVVPYISFKYMYENVIVSILATLFEISQFL